GAAPTAKKARTKKSDPITLLTFMFSVFGPKGVHDLIEDRVVLVSLLFGFARLLAGFRASVFGFGAFLAGNIAVPGIFSLIRCGIGAGGFRCRIFLLLLLLAHGQTLASQFSKTLQHLALFTGKFRRRFH